MKIKFFPIFLKKNYLHFHSMQRFSADATTFSKKKYFLPMKNCPQQLIIGLNSFFSTGLAAQTSPELISYIINMSQDSSVY